MKFNKVVLKLSTSVEDKILRKFIGNIKLKNYDIHIDRCSCSKNKIIFNETKNNNSIKLEIDYSEGLILRKNISLLLRIKRNGIFEIYIQGHKYWPIYKGMDLVYKSQKRHREAFEDYFNRFSLEEKKKFNKNFFFSSMKFHISNCFDMDVLFFEKLKVNFPPHRQIIGIDLGAINFIADSAKRIYGGTDYNIHTIKEYQINHLAKLYASNYEYIALETLDYDALYSKWSEKWKMFISALTRSGGKLLYIDKFYPSSKKCSICRSINESLDLRIREWTCDKCGNTFDRDVNAAINIRNEGFRIVRFFDFDKWKKSRQWEITKLRYYNSKLNKKCCYICDSKENLDIYHRSYKSLGNEKLNHLVQLCDSCHYNVRKFLFKHRSNKISLWKAVKKLRKRKSISKKE